VSSLQRTAAGAAVKTSALPPLSASRLTVATKIISLQRTAAGAALNTSALPSLSTSRLTVARTNH
jgi:hypothetical protein